MGFQKKSLLKLKIDFRFFHFFFGYKMSKEISKKKAKKNGF